jgi:hypothetical protein
MFRLFSRRRRAISPDDPFRGIQEQLKKGRDEIARGHAQIEDGQKYLAAVTEELKRLTGDALIAPRDTDDDSAD